MTAERQAESVGTHHDGMHGFRWTGERLSRRFVLALNNEYIDQQALWAPQGGPTNAEAGARPAEESRTEINAHGVTLVEVRAGRRWSLGPRAGLPYNRRFSSVTEMELAGPVAGSDYVKTRFLAGGAACPRHQQQLRQRLHPWGTYLSCEENWPNIFVNTGERFADDARIGIPTERGRYGWETSAGDPTEENDEFARFDITPRGAEAREDYRNEARTFGYQVEIDPYDGSRRAVKRTALGRFRHEGCWLGKPRAGQAGGLLFGPRCPQRATSTSSSPPPPGIRPMPTVPARPMNRLAIGAKYLDEGVLYAARFDADGGGERLALSPQALTQDGRRSTRPWGWPPTTRPASSSIPAMPPT